MIFAVYPKVAVKLGDERYEFDRASLMFPEVVEIENVTGMSYGEWESQLRRYSISAVAALLHVLRKRAGVASDFRSMNFAAGDLDVIPLHPDGQEYTIAEVEADIMKRSDEAREAANPTSGTAADGGGRPLEVTSGTSPSSQNGSASAPGNGNGSRGGTSRSARRISTRS